MSKQWVVYDNINHETEMYSDYDEALKAYEETKDHYLDSEGCTSDEEVYLFEMKKKAQLVEDKDNKEDPQKYGFDFWVKWQDIDY